MTANKFIKKYMDTFLEISYNNEAFALMTLHLLLGRCTWQVRFPKKWTWADCRISLWYLAPPSSGKSTPYDFIKEILDQVEGTPEQSALHDVDDTSDAKLIGYHDKENDDEYVPGILDRGGVVHWDEAAMLLGTSQYAEKTKGFLQKALNPIGSATNACSRDFKSDSITIYPTCSLYLTSYIPDGIIEKVLGTGQLQRMLVVAKQISTDERRANAHKDIDNWGVELEDREFQIQYFTKEFQAISKEYNNPSTKFNWEEIRPMIKAKSDQLLDISRNSPINIKKLLETFHARYDEQMGIIAMHHCCLRHSHTINFDDIEYASNLIKLCYSSILAWLEEEPSIETGEIQENQYYITIKNIFKKEAPEDGEIPSTRFIELCCKKWNRTAPTIHKRIEPLLELPAQGKPGLNKRKQGRAVFYSLT